MNVLELINTQLPVYRQALDKKDLARLKWSHAAWMQNATPGSDEIIEYVFLLIHEIQESLERQQVLTLAFGDFNQQIGTALTAGQRREIVLSFSTKLGANRRQLFRDGRAFSLFFGADAVTDRYINVMGRLDRDLSLYLDRLGYAAEYVLSRESSDDKKYALWGQLALEEELTPLLAHLGDARVQQATFASLARAIRGLSPSQRESALSDTTLRYVYRCALQSSLSVWIQVEALDLLGEMSRDSFIEAVRSQLTRKAVKDGMFVRARLMRLVTEHIADVAQRDEFAHILVRDESAFVRQAVATNLTMLSSGVADELLELLVADPVVAVSAKALAQFGVLANASRVELYIRLIELSTNANITPQLIRQALICAQEAHAILMEVDVVAASVFSESVVEHCRSIRKRDERTRVRRYAAQAGEQLWAQSNVSRMALLTALSKALEDLRPGKRKRLPVSLVGNLDTVDLGRILSLLALMDHGFDVEFSRLHIHVYRGHVFRPSLWRILHESRISATDKRQGFRHTIGRHFHGTLIAPSSILCEQAKTKVPGEPLYIDDEDGWRPFLPLVDNMIGALDRGYPVDPIKLVSTEGTTEILPPTSPMQRLKARWFLNHRFVELAELRNWQPRDAGQDPGDYVRALHDLGFRIRFRPHDWHQDELEERVNRFFPAPAMATSLPLVMLELVDRSRDYFYSLYQNTLGHLALFLAGMSVIFFGQHLVANQKIRTARKSIAMVIGGWGTRGKSGTERLKAGLFNGLGYTIVSKTSGCEAMFIFARPFGRAREMFLFRPYDKATIWEQADLLSLSKGLSTEVFLWECMALTPSFVEILQRQWMRDDYSTITNAYPDHEDIQGPAGVNIPEVIGNFIPRNGKVVTTEEFMLPILRSEARRVGSSMAEVGWREALQLAPDILDRFPYEEHPYNISLVIRLCDMLEIETDFALKEMADRVIADLGVLKTFPRATVDGRRIEFVNGMSANERFGCLGNWRRMEFEDQDPVVEPDVWIVTVVNNRADRVARSKVFASILVSDLAADAHVLIGTNVNGLMSYIDEAWEEAFANFSLGEVDGDERLQAVLGWLQRFRVPIEAEHLALRVRMLGEHIDAAAWMARFERQHKEAQVVIAKAVDPAVRLEELENHLAKQLRYWFDEKLVPLEDSGLTGEQVVHRVVTSIPTGMLGRVIGIQNIKGTGLDFIYRWLAWEAVHKACEQIMGDDARQNEEGRQLLLGFQEFGLLSEERVREALEAVHSRANFQTEAVQAQLNAIELSLNASVEKVRATLVETDSSGESGNRFLERIHDGFEQILDSFDAIGRRRRADLIYRELVAERISPDRASLELQQLNKRQKGGWLKKRLASR